MPSDAKRGCSGVPYRIADQIRYDALPLGGCFCYQAVVYPSRKSQRGEVIFTFAILTISTRGFAGEREDKSGPLILSMIKGYGNVVELTVVPDDRQIIEDNLIRLADTKGVDAIFTTGGTGFAPSDITPEATMAVVDRLAPGIPEAMRYQSMKHTDRAMLSRGLAGIRGQTLIVNLPGSPKAVAENLEVFLPVMEHGLFTLRGETVDCAVTNGAQKDNPHGNP